jgi:hypothetical protein
MVTSVLRATACVCVRSRGSGGSRRDEPRSDSDRRPHHAEPRTFSYIPRPGSNRLHAVPDSGGGGGGAGGTHDAGRAQMPPPPPPFVPPPPPAAHAPRDGDWACTGCAASNFARRAECFRCNAPKAAHAEVLNGNGGGNGGGGGGGGGGAWSSLSLSLSLSLLY